jgi:glycerol-3-phosphate O-acyltransferase
VVSGDTIGAEVVRRVVTHVLAEMDAAPSSGTPRLAEKIQETVYSEEQRLAHGHHDTRWKSDRAFVASLRRWLPRADESRQQELLLRIVEHYLAEIGGKFDPRIYALATRGLPLALGSFLKGVRRTAGSPSTRTATEEIEEGIRISGDVERLQRIARRGTIVLAPSHVSNLDSVLLGWAIYRLGLPPFAYGAGLNLFSNAIIGFFMRNLGAYTVDRKKTDPLYRQTLKEYSTVLLEHGQHSLFFPGGTRSRSGAVEHRLKLGLLGTAPVAFRGGLAKGTGRPIFVVPCTLTYPLVLEARSLVDEFLRAEGRARYIDGRDEFDRPLKWLDFMRALVTLDLGIHVHFGRPIDVVGNDVDDDGESLDPHGRRVDPSGYFSDAFPLGLSPQPPAVVRGDAARDAEYTRMISARLIEAYRRDTFALPSSVLAFAVFERLRRAAAQPDLFRLLGAIHPDTFLPLDAVRSDVALLCEELRGLESRGRVRLTEELRSSAPSWDRVVWRALDVFAAYHRVPAVELKGDRLRVGSASLLFYYRNRLDGLGLLGAPELLDGKLSGGVARTGSLP